MTQNIGKKNTRHCCANKNWETRNKSFFHFVRTKCFKFWTGTRLTTIWKPLELFWINNWFVSNLKYFTFSFSFQKQKIVSFCKDKMFWILHLDTFKKFKQFRNRCYTAVVLDYSLRNIVYKQLKIFYIFFTVSEKCQNKYRKVIILIK